MENNFTIFMNRYNKCQDNDVDMLEEFDYKKLYKDFDSGLSESENSGESFLEENFLTESSTLYIRDVDMTLSSKNIPSYLETQEYNTIETISEVESHLEATGREHYLLGLSNENPNDQCKKVEGHPLNFKLFCDFRKTVPTANSQKLSPKKFIFYDALKKEYLGVNLENSPNTILNNLTGISTAKKLQVNSPIIAGEPCEAIIQPKLSSSLSQKMLNSISTFSDSNIFSKSTFGSNVKNDFSFNHNFEELNECSLSDSKPLSTVIKSDSFHPKSFKKIETKELPKNNRILQVSKNFYNFEKFNTHAPIKSNHLRHFSDIPDAFNTKRVSNLNSVSDRGSLTSV